MNALLFALLPLVSSVSGFAHRSMENPISRMYLVFLENPISPTSYVGKVAVAFSGTQAFYDWH